MVEPPIHLNEYIQVILHRRWIVITFFTVVVTTVIIGTLSQTPIYQATTTLLIEAIGPQVVSFKEVAPVGPTGYQAYREYYETQYTLIKSPPLLEKVADYLNVEIASPQKKRYTFNKLLEAINVEPVKGSQLVEISAQDPHPQTAAKIANLIAEEYVRGNLERNVNTINQASQWLSKRIEDQRQKLREAELALQKYREKQKISVLPQISGEAAMEDIKAEYAKAQAQLANYSERYTDDHPKIVELKAQIKSLRSRIQGLEDVEEGGKTMEYRVLEREVQTNKGMYEVLLTRLKEIDLSSTLNVSNISIVDIARVPGKPIKPKIMLNITLAIMVGLLGGTGLAFFTEYMDVTIKNPQDVREILKSYLLGIVPSIEEKEESKKSKIMVLQPKSLASESYRAIRTEISHLMMKEKEQKVILLTSVEPQAGKTMVSSNLAIALAQRGSKVLLVDSDLRRPHLHKVFNLERHQGLGEYLSPDQDPPLETVIKDTDVENLKVITSGEYLPNPAELLDSKRLDELIRILKTKFDFVIFDSPPLGSIADSFILADKVDVIVQVVRSGKALVPVALRVKELLAKSKAKVLGVILNDLEIYPGSYYYRYSHYYEEESEQKKPPKESQG